VAALLVLLGGSQTRAAPPSRPLAHTEITADAVWGPGVVTVTEDVVIKNGATLVIKPGTTVRIFTDTVPYPGGVSDTKIEIIVEDGRLVADGFYTSLALDSADRPRISYYSLADGSVLKYASWDGTAWQIETVDSNAGSGYYTSLVLDSANRPHISHYDFHAKELRYTWWGP